MNIRSAKYEDARAIAEVHVKSWQETYKGILDQDILDNLKVESREKLWREILNTKNEAGPVFTASNEEGNIVGFSSFGPERTKKFEADGELYAIYLLEKYQGKQIGTELFLAGVKELSKAGFSSVLVWVLADNKNRKFYEKLEPVKAAEEEVTIAGANCLEIAYVWKDINKLIDTIECKLMKEEEGINKAFESFPMMETKRLILRKIDKTDAANMFDYFSKDEVTRYYDLETFTSEDQAAELIGILNNRYIEKKQIRWGIALKESNELIGTCGFHSIEEEHRKAEIGYELHPEYWGQGIMTEVAEEIVNFGFKQMGLNRIEAFYDPDNPASGRVLEKIGFEYEGLLKQRYFEKGKFVDAALSAILNKEISR